MSDIQKIPEHEDHIDRIRKDHVPAAGDVFLKKDTFYADRLLIRLKEEVSEGVFAYESIDPETGEVLVAEDERRGTISLSSLKEYYRLLLGGLDETLAAGAAIIGGDAKAGEKRIFKAEGEDPAGDPDTPDTIALTKGRSKEDVAAMLQRAERVEDRLAEVRHMAKLIMAQKRRELERNVEKMEAVLKEYSKKVKSLVKVITVLNLYTGKTVALEAVTDGEAADPSEKLHIRQRILYMDEEMCAHLDHEADYQDIPTFIEMLKDPGFRDLIVPEPRCIVAVKPKRFDMGYSSGNSLYDHQREAWNRHTYLILRNGEKVFVSESDDLECWKWVFPHKDHESAFAAKMADPRTSFKDSIQHDHEADNYRVIKFVMTVQGIIDNAAATLGPFDAQPNIAKNRNVVLVRDDEDALGTGLPSFSEFRKKKNALLRRGKRVVYIPGPSYRDGINSRRWHGGGDFRRYYAYENSEPETPGEGVYNLRKEKEGEKFWFSYLPGGTVWPRNYWEDEHERRRKEGWTPAMDHVLNYDDTSSAELQAYFDDRTKREEYRSMMPVLKRALLEKKNEEAAEEAFIDLMLNHLHREEPCCGIMRQDIREAIAWWKEKVIFTRPLRSDDAKAWRMILRRVKGEKQQ